MKRQSMKRLSMKRLCGVGRFVIRGFGLVVVAGLLVVPGAGASGASGWVVVPTPNPLTGTGQAFSVACVTASDCVAVGSHVTRSGRGEALAERWDGRRWRILHPANPAFARVTILNGVACTTSVRCVAVGETWDARGTRRTFAELRQGRDWRIVETPTGPGQSTFLAVGCRSSTACFAVGYTDAGLLIERWDGSSWSRTDAPAPSGAQGSELTGVSCTPRRCVAVGDYVDASGTDRPLTERWTAGRWRPLQAPAPDGVGFSFLSGVSCTPGTGCVAVGGSSAGTLVERLTGAGWQIQLSPSPKGAQFSGLFAVSCASAMRCSAVGGYLTSDFVFVSLAAQWNGTRWRLRTTHDPRGDTGNFLAGVACPQASSCLAVGQTGGDGTPTVLADRWDGVSWHLQGAPSPLGPAETQLNGVSCPSRIVCTAVGTAGPTRGSTSTVAERWDGSHWRLQATPSPAGGNLNGVSCPLTGWCMAVGGSADGTLAERWNGRRWQIQPIPTPNANSGLGGIKCLSPSFCMAAGAYTTASGDVLPLAERWDGHAWHILHVSPAAGTVQTFLGGIDCRAADWCTAVGEQHFASGLVRPIADHWNGQTWSVQPTVSPAGVGFANLPSISCTATTRCIAVGGSDNGAIAEQWNGSAWHLLTVPSPSPGASLTGVSCLAPRACTAIGFYFTDAGGQLLAERWNGTTWNEQPTPLFPGVHDMAQPAVSCPTRGSCIAVGGYEPDGPGSITLAEHWTPGTSSGTTGITRPHPLTSGPGTSCLIAPAWKRLSTACG